MRWTVAVAALLVPVLHPMLRPAVGVPAHLLWFTHALAVAIAAYSLGLRGAAGATLASVVWVLSGEHLFGAGYWQGADDATMVALATAIGFTDILIAGFALTVRAEQDRRHRMEAQLLQAQKMEAIGRLAGGVAHDFNNLLTAILGTTQLLTETMPRDDPRREDLEAIEQASLTASRLTHQLLTFSRRQPVAARAVDLNALVREMEGMLRRLLGEDVELVTRLEPRLGRVLADPGQLEQVVLNLAVNARDAMPEGGRITIETANADVDQRTRVAELAPGRYVMLAVEDTGLGMDRETRARLFEPFFTTKPPGKGTGLGLATVFGAVRQSSGGIVVSSTPGHGTTMQAYFPRLELPPAQAAPSPERAVRQRGGETVLLVEDEPAVRETTRRVLESRGFHVVIAATPSEAAALVERDPFSVDLVVSDVVMPVMSGPQLAEHVGVVAPHLPILFLSGYAREAAGMGGALKSGRHFLQKPYTTDDLVSNVRGAIDGARLRLRAFADDSYAQKAS
jgi:signal transduction histidine kinase/ActR/RegA family two-component response regulator